MGEHKMKFLRTAIGSSMYARFIRPHYHAFVRVGGKDVERIVLPECELDSEFIADPFLFRRDGVNWLFFEGLYADRGNRGRSKGVIGCFKQVGARWEYQGVVLEQPWHLSYPQVFAESGHVYMIPESGQAHEIALYEAVDFPVKWRKKCVLVEGDYLDSSLAATEEGYYLITVAERPDATPEVWHAKDLLGIWTRHPQSGNVLSGKEFRRNGGAIIEEKGRLYRIAQDCNGGYGIRLYRIPIMDISPTRYREGAPALLAEAIDWPQHGMHHTYNRLTFEGGTIEVIDNHFNTVKRSAALASSAMWYVIDGFRWIFGKNRNGEL